MTSSTSLTRRLADVAGLLRGFPYFLHTLFLFTKSDFKTTIFPTVSTSILVACAAKH